MRPSRRARSSVRSSLYAASCFLYGPTMRGRAANESGTAALCAAVSVQHVPLRGLAGAFEEGRAAGAQVGLGRVHRLAGDFRLCPLCGLHALNDAGLQGRTAQRRACTGSNRLYLRHDFRRYDLPREDEP